MKNNRTIIYMASLFLVFSSCKQDQVLDPAPPKKGCSLSILKQFDGFGLSTLGGTFYKESQLSYENKNLKEVINFTRGTKDLTRRVAIIDGLVKSVSFYDANEILKIRYSFNYAANSKRIESAEVRYDNISPAVTEAYLFTYNQENKVSELKLYSNNLLMEKIKYFYSIDQGKQVIKTETYEVSTANPNHHHLSVKDEFHYDDKQTGEIHPAFVINLYHQTRLDLLLPDSRNNIEKYYHYHNTAEVNEVPVLKLSQSVSFDRSITYNKEDYPIKIVENRLNGYKLEYELTYSDCK
ncbi:hypothetical protein [Sphingobacterium mizutaii]|uniref:hypothetical protein n=1 Tax=Sphingobacterium mizutaii TaxID=1010 RepID=UPI00289CA387|nr:hypothetical protein [Sphingobacterium mizutaii]